MFLPRLGARPWPHSGPGAQYPNVINEEIEAQKLYVIIEHLTMLLLNSKFMS